MSYHIDLDNPPDVARPYVDLYERTFKELKVLKAENARVREVNEQIRSERDLLQKDLASRPPHIAAKVSHGSIDEWCVRLYRLSGIQVVKFETANGLVNVPNKYVAIFDAMHLAMVNLSEGLTLPEFAVAPKKKPKKAKRRV